jgi:hypothetical protein
MLALVLGLIPLPSATADRPAAHGAKALSTIASPLPAPAPVEGVYAGQAPAQAVKTPSAPAVFKLTRRPDGTTDNLEDAVSGWIRTISQEKGFEDWEGAQTEITPLGPGTHSQLVVLRKNGKEAGYLVAASTPDGGWKLAEYGVGEYGLFSLNTLYRSLKGYDLLPGTVTYSDFLADEQIRRLRVYLSPLESFWIIGLDADTLYFDAKTAAPLPDLTGSLDMQTQLPAPAGAAASGAKYRISDSLLTGSFDPFLRAAWIRGSSLDLAEDAVTVLSEGLAQGRKITYAARLFKGKVTAPFAVTGFQTWSNGSSYFFLDHDGTRAIPYAELAQKGRFYPAGDE